MREKLISFLKKEIKNIDVEKFLEVPKVESQGDFALPMFTLAKDLKKAPPVIAKEFEEKLSKKLPYYISKVVAVGPFLNFYLNKILYIKENLVKVVNGKESFLEKEIKVLKSENKKKKVLIDFSSPNIAKPLSIGHLRNTVIGQFFCNLYRYGGYDVVGINHLGDWGTQFGILIVGFEKYSKKSIDEVKKLDEPNKYLVDIYIKINDDIKAEIEKNGTSELRDRAKEISFKIENKEEPYFSMWRSFVDAGIKELKGAYKRINVSFDEWIGESFYEDLIDDTKKILVDKKIAKRDDGALIVDLESEKLGVGVVERSDGGSVYLTRDIAAVIYRKKKFKFDKCLYVVGPEQKHHFNQLFSIADKLGYSKDEFEHLYYGLLSFKGKKVATRGGNLVYLEDVVNQATSMALENIKEKSPNLKNKEEAARVIGMGVAFFGDLKNDRIKDVSFDWDNVLDFRGDTSVYLQYTYARIKSILRKAKFDISKIDKSVFSKLETEEDYFIVKHIFSFESIIRDAIRQNKSHLIAEYLLKLAQRFNDYYAKYKVIQESDKELESARLVLIFGVAYAIREGLKVLNIDVLEEM